MKSGAYIGSCFFPNLPKQIIESARLVVNDESYEVELPNNGLGYLDREIICGTFNGIGQITFINCTLFSGHGGVGGSSMKFRAEFCISDHFTTIKELVFQEVEVFIPALFKWLQIHSIKTNLMFGDDKFVKLEEPEDIQICEVNGFTLTLIFYSSFNAKMREGEVTLKEGAGINLKSTSTAKHLREYVEVISNFRKLLFFLTNAPCQVDSITLFNSNESNIKLHTNQFKPFNSSINYLRNFTYQNLKPDLEKIVSRWFGDQQIHVSLDLILEKSLNNGLSRENFFLNSCFALETLHRNFQDYKLLPQNQFKKLKEQLLKNLNPEETVFVKNKLSHFNSPSFRERLMSYKEDFNSLIPMELDAEEYIASIVRTRNFLVHRSSQRNVFDSFEMLYAAIHLDGIVKLQVFKLLEVDENTIKKEYSRMQENLTNKYRLNRIKEPREKSTTSQL